MILKLQKLKPSDFYQTPAALYEFTEDNFVNASFLVYSQWVASELQPIAYSTHLRTGERTNQGQVTS